MDEYKKRMLTEFQELNIKCIKLEEFIKTSKEFQGLDIAISLLMKNQLHFMQGYRQCLYDRINLTISSDELEKFDIEK